MASSLAARLRRSLAVLRRAGHFQKTRQVLRQLQVQEKLFVGKAPAGLKATELPDIRSVLAWLKEQKLDTPYLALVNTRDRKATTVRKLSLAAPIFAAAHDGMVVPIDADIHWRVPFKGKPFKGDLPKGIPAGSKPPKAGVIELAEGKVPFVLSYGASGNEYLLSLDLDGNGSFDGPNEDPLRSNGVVTLLGKPRTLDFGRKMGTDCDLSVTTGSAEEIVGSTPQTLRCHRHSEATCASSVFPTRSRRPFSQKETPT